MDARIAAAFADDARSDDVSRLLAEVEAAAVAGEADAEAARARALDPLLSSNGAALARREMDDDFFKRDRLQEAARRLSERVEAVRALEAERHARAEHERVSVERNRLAEEMQRMAEPIAEIARLVSEIERFDREIGRLNATSTARLGYVRPVLSGASPVVEGLFRDGVVWDAFIAVAGLHSLPTTRKIAGATDARQRPP